MQKRRKRPKGARKPVVQAEAFEVVDQAGNVVARLGPVSCAGVVEPGTGLVLLDESGAARLTLSLDSSGPAIHLIAGGIVRVSIAVVDSTATLAVRGLDGIEAFHGRCQGVSGSLTCRAAVGLGSRASGRVRTGCR